MKRLKWSEVDLKEHRKGEMRKVKIARQLRKEAVMTLKWNRAAARNGRMDPGRQPSVSIRKNRYVSLLGTEQFTKILQKNA
jgi:hypothetical protein